MRYLTDGTRLYEVVEDSVVENFGLLGGVIRRAILRECVTEHVSVVDALNLAALSEV